MTTLRETMAAARRIILPASPPPVAQTVAEAIRLSITGEKAQIEPWSKWAPAPGTIWLGVADRTVWRSVLPNLDHDRDWMMARLQTEGGVELWATRPHLLYGLLNQIQEEWGAFPAEEFQSGKVLYMTFENLRPVYDLFLTQHARTVRGFNREEYFRELARMGFTQAEVNGLAFPEAAEAETPGEVYPRFYTYGPALDQFVSSRLNQGMYSETYLHANLERLKWDAGLAVKYGMAPGLLCYEPRSVPDKLLERHPHLRGARVDHPYRSFRPRYNLSLGHPTVRDHYAELMENLLRAVPTLEYMTIWSNDSGAGFEYTNSLYVGRNGGGYVIREWKGDAEITEAAAHNLVRFLKLLRDAARKINPKFRVLLRLEPFAAEQDGIERELTEGVDIETSSLLARGWDLKYSHPKYPEVPQVHTTMLHHRFLPEERPAIETLRRKGVRTDVLFSPGVLWNHEPLMGIPFPFLVYEKLDEMAKAGVGNAASLGGVVPRSFVPWNLNQELIRAFQRDRGLKLGEFLHATAAKWVGENLSWDLVECWRAVDQAWRSFPVPVWIYSAWGVWYRVAVRPIIPDIEAIPEADRAYYEKHLLSTFHNPTRIDLRRDVGFDLLDPARAALAVKHMDGDLSVAMNSALSSVEKMNRNAKLEAARAYLQDLGDRLWALKCWFRTQRNLAAWVAGVHGYLEAKDDGVRANLRKSLREMVLDEVVNTKDLLRLWETSKTNWMIVGEGEETTFLYGKNFGELLKRKIELMKGRENDEPKVDPNFAWRTPGEKREGR